MDPILEFFNSLEIWELALLVVGAVVTVVLCIVCLCYCCFGRRRAKPDRADIEFAKMYTAQKYGAQSGPGSYQRQFSTNTIAKNLNAAPSRQIAGFKKGKGKKNRAPMPDVEAQIDEASIKPEREDGGGLTFNKDVMKNLATKQKQNSGKKSQDRLSYGRLNPESQERIKSVRMQASANNLMPIRSKPPSAKALKMMGISAEEAQNQYAESVDVRMKRIAAAAGGGIYSTGFSTSKLGGQVVDGFRARREALEDKKRQKKEKNEFQKNLQTLKREKKKRDTEIQKKPKAPPKKSNNNLAAFLAASQSSSNDNDDDDDDNNDKPDENNQEDEDELDI